MNTLLATPWVREFYTILAEPLNIKEGSRPEQEGILAGIEISELPWSDIINIALIIILPFLLFPKIATLMIILMLFFIVSAGNIVYHQTRIEIHSAVIMFFGMVYGPLPCIMMSALIYNPIYKTSLRIGLPSPVLTFMDISLMCTVGILGSFLPQANYFLYGVIILVAMDVARSIIKATIHHDPIQLVFPIIYGPLTYFFLLRFAKPIIIWLGGTV